MESQLRSWIGMKGNRTGANTALPSQLIRMTMADGLIFHVTGSSQAHCAR